jgi:RecA/RadA recombinase
MRADKIQNEPVRWLWKDRIPEGAITVIAGRPGGAKTLLAARLAADVAKMGKNVILSASEDNRKQMTGPRLSALHARKNRIIIDFEPEFPEDMERLAKIVERSKVKIMICDPVNEHLSHGVSRYNDSIRKATKPLKKFCEETGLAVVLIDHVLKNVSKNSHPLAAIGGASSGLTAAARMVYIVGRDPSDKDRVLMCNIKSNLANDPEPWEFAMDEEEVEGIGSMPLLIDTGECPGYDPMEMLARQGKSGKAGRSPTKREAAIEFLIDYLTVAPNHEARATDVTEDAKQYGITKRTLDGAKADADVESIKRGKEWWWKLPPELIAVIDASS